MSFKLFIDFDGTVTLEDIGEAFFLHFGGPSCADHVREYHEGRISASECFRRETAAIGALTLDEADRFLRTKLVVAGFPEFVRFCREVNLEFHIVSDGLDLYIRRVLEYHGVGELSLYSNRLELEEVGGGRLRPMVVYPYQAEGCDRCACCKRNILLGLSGEEDIIGYIGEGFSDRCAVQYADIVFAKDDLQRYCQQENISYFPYQDFFDIQARVDALLSRKNLRKRRRAELKRREAFLCEA
jgi:2,3-diketo-5-methylthio-1-phosphopentane phosphatase